MEKETVKIHSGGTGGGGREGTAAQLGREKWDEEREDKDMMVSMAEKSQNDV